MTPNGTRRRARLLTPLVVSLMLVGCSAMDVKKQTVTETEVIRKGPEAAPRRSITGFSDALRCMDTTLANYGVRDVSVLVEDILDQTKKVNAGTKDMLISAVSEMSTRSRAIRLIAFGQDSGNLITFLQQAQRISAYAVTPQFDIKGSITQLDENLIQSQADAGLGFDSGGSFGIGIGYAKDAASNILALDLTMLDTEDFSVLPGVTSRNAVVIFKEGQGFDADATISKFGINYNMSLSRSEGQSQALRSLVELAAVELFGKLTRTPYWICLGSTGVEPEVQRELEDWYHGFEANPPQLTAWFQNQLRLRGYYRGEVDGADSHELRTAAAGYRRALGLPDGDALDFEFFSAYLAADHANVLAKFPAPPAGGIAALAATPSSASSSAPPAAPSGREQSARPAPFALAVSAPNGQQRFSRGELINLNIVTTRDAHVYCYLQDEDRKIQRFFPNRFARDAFVKAGTTLQLPGEMRFQFVANSKGVREQVACFGAERDLMPELPGAVVGTDFENLSVSSLERIREAYRRVAGTDLAEGNFNVDVR
ncbi:MAG: DUF4384 domain-containing protein [Azoarcus sp.]|nr:DUF4384 domain-containing protein [Azoarcus sp.]